MNTRPDKMPSIFLCLLLLLAAKANALGTQTDLPRPYQLTLAEPIELEQFATNGIALNSLGYTLYHDHIAPGLNNSLHEFVAPAWSIFWTFSFTMWPHDGGHWARARQAGGDFKLVRYRFPMPEMKMVQPTNASAAEETLMSSGGFEINNLATLHTRRRFMHKGRAWFDDLIHSFIQSVFFPFYSTVLAYTDPTKPQTWTNTYGDPVEYTALLFRHYTARREITSDGRVDPYLPRLYRQIYWANLAWTLLDPLLYQSARAFAVDPKNQAAYLNAAYVNTPYFKWQYSTLFNPGALGYELYLLQYFKMHQQLYSLYLREGRPFRNHGLGIQALNIFQQDKLSMDFYADIWDQDIYGRGIAAGVIPRYLFNKHWLVALDLSWKDAGYLLGRQLPAGYRLLGQVQFQY